MARGLLLEGQGEHCAALGEYQEASTRTRRGFPLVAIALVHRNWHDEPHVAIYYLTRAIQQDPNPNPNPNLTLTVTVTVTLTLTRTRATCARAHCVPTAYCSWAMSRARCATWATRGTWRPPTRSSSRCTPSACSGSAASPRWLGLGLGLGLEARLEP